MPVAIVATVQAKVPPIPPQFPELTLPEVSYGGAGSVPPAGVLPGYPIVPPKVPQNAASTGGFDPAHAVLKTQVGVSELMVGFDTGRASMLMMHGCPAPLPGRLLPQVLYMPEM